ncbi:MAG: hypothetical protein ACREX0_20330, partial [Noviherbaspirillum sp.]
WLQLAKTREVQPYLVMDGNGTVLGNAALPSNTAVVAADRGSVWAIEKDENGVQSIVKYVIAVQ